MAIDASPSPSPEFDDRVAEVVPIVDAPSAPFSEKEAAERLKSIHLSAFLACAVDGVISNKDCKRFAALMRVTPRTMRRYQHMDACLREHHMAISEPRADIPALRVEAAEKMGVSLDRVIAMEQSGDVLARARTALAISDEAEHEYAAREGNATALAEHLREHPEIVGRSDARGLSDSNVRAAIVRGIAAPVREIYKAGAKAGDGAKLRVNRRLVDVESPVREFQIDGRKLCRALLDGKAVDVIVVSVVDVATGACAGLHVGTTEDQQAVLLALFDAAVSTDQFPLGGLPLGGRLTSDNGPGETADAITRACEALDIYHHTVEAFTPNQNGGVEAWHDMMRARLDHRLGFRPDGRRKRSEKLFQDADSMLPFETVRREVRDFQRWATFDRERAFLDGRTSAEAFCEEPWGISSLLPEHMVWLLPSVSAQVKRYGVRIGHGLAYTSPELADLYGITVDVRYVPLALESVYVVHDGRVICRADHRLDESQAGELAGRSRNLEEHAVSVLNRVAAQARERAERERQIEDGLPPKEPVAGRDTWTEAGSAPLPRPSSPESRYVVDDDDQGIAQ